MLLSLQRRKEEGNRAEEEWGEGYSNLRAGVLEKMAEEAGRTMTCHSVRSSLTMFATASQRHVMMTSHSTQQECCLCLQNKTTSFRIYGEGVSVAVKGKY